MQFQPRPDRRIIRQILIIKTNTNETGNKKRHRQEAIVESTDEMNGAKCIINSVGRLGDAHVTWENGNKGSIVLRRLRIES